LIAITHRSHQRSWAKDEAKAASVLRDYSFLRSSMKFRRLAGNSAPPLQFRIRKLVVVQRQQQADDSVGANGKYDRDDK